MRRQYTRTPHILSFTERIAQINAGLEPGTMCSVGMVKGTAVIKGGRRVGTKRDGGTPIGQCPRYAVKVVNGQPLCSAHGHGRQADTE